MGAEVSQDSDAEETSNPDSSVPKKQTLKTQQVTKPGETEGEVDFGAVITQPKNSPAATRRKRVVSPPRPNLDDMDDDEAFNIVCNEMDQALAGHYSFLLSATAKHPTIHQLEKLLEEHGYKVGSGD